MKLLILLPSLLLLFSASIAQKEIPSFGKVDKTELEMKDCEYDKGAEAVVLFDVGEVYCSLNFNALFNPIRTEMSRHVRIKILNTKGSDQANVKIPYLSFRNIEDIKNLSAQTINQDANGEIKITKVDKDAIYRKKVNKRYSEVIFTFPDVKPGSIIEYKYKDDATELYAVKNWYFQKSIPVLYSSYQLDFPNELVISAIPKGNFYVGVTEKSKSIRNIKTFTCVNSPALKDEAFISCKEDYLMQVTPLMIAIDIPGTPRKSLVRTWPGIIKELMEDEDFGLQLKKNVPRTSDLDALLAQVTDPYKKMVIIHDYVKKNMQWNETLGIWAMDGIKAAWKDKKGTSGEINLILVNLLKDADLNASPVLVSTHDNGMINTGVAGFDQFNKVMAYVTINDNFYVLDATDKHTPANLIPFSVVNSEGLVIEKISTYEWGWKTLWNKNQMFNQLIFINGVVDENLMLKGAASVTSKDYSRAARIPILKENQSKFASTWINSNNQDIKIDNLKFTNSETDTLPLVQEFEFEKKINSSGDYNYFSVNLFTGLEKNLFLADERFSDVFFGANQRYNITGLFSIPDSYQFDALPKNIKMIMPDTSIVFSRIANVSGDLLTVRITLEFNKPYFINSDYPYFKEFYKKLFEFLNEQFVFKKK